MRPLHLCALDGLMDRDFVTAEATKLPPPLLLLLLPSENLNPFWHHSRNFSAIQAKDRIECLFREGIVRGNRVFKAADVFYRGQMTISLGTVCQMIYRSFWRGVCFRRFWFYGHIRMWFALDFSFEFLAARGIFKEPAVYFKLPEGLMDTDLDKGWNWLAPWKRE